MKRFLRSGGGGQGFTLVELAVVLALVGFLSAGGILVANKVMQNRMRDDALAYMQEVKAAILTYAQVTGKVPLADVNYDGRQDTGRYFGYIPFADLGVKPFDPWGRRLWYEKHGKLIYDRAINCSNLAAGFAAMVIPVGTWAGRYMPLGMSGRPYVTESCPPTAWSPNVAFVLVSAGARNADDRGNQFDYIDNCGLFSISTFTSTGRYTRHPMTNRYDDLTLYVGETEMYEAMQCGTAETPE